MNEGPPDEFENIARLPETPSEELVENVFRRLMGGEGFHEIRKREDAEGLYLWDVKSGNNEYSYMRKGRYEEGQASETAIHVTFYDDSGTPCGGHSVAKFRNGVFEITP